MPLFNGRFELALYVLIARGVVLEMPQLSTTDSKGLRSPTPEDPTLSSSSADKDQKIFDQVDSRLAKDIYISSKLYSVVVFGIYQYSVWVWFWIL